jgi:hypothetical protein
VEKKIDITSKVQGKLEDGRKMGLFLDEKKVGQIIMTDQGNHYEMAEGFEFDKDKIYKHENDTIEYTKKYVDDCDMGWC